MAPLGTALPEVDERALPERSEDEDARLNGAYIVILYNDDYHAMDEVVIQLQKATGYDIEKCVRIMVEAHTGGRAIAYSGSEEACERCANILRQIRLQVETDRA
jgi:ATP-dependent Clp protease adaptor protein ClpS